VEQTHFSNSLLSCISISLLGQCTRTPDRQILGVIAWIFHWNNSFMILQARYKILHIIARRFPRRDQGESASRCLKASTAASCSKRMQQSAQSAVSRIDLRTSKAAFFNVENERTRKTHRQIQGHGQWMHASVLQGSFTHNP
jgi:hypothetical protein